MQSAGAGDKQKNRTKGHLLITSRRQRFMDDSSSPSSASSSSPACAMPKGHLLITSRRQRFMDDSPSPSSASSSSPAMRASRKQRGPLPLGPGRRSQNLTRIGGDREILRRALSPPVRQHGRLGLRRWTFRPAPSRLSNMSMA